VRPVQGKLLFGGLQPQHTLTKCKSGNAVLDFTMSTSHLPIRALIRTCLDMIPLTTNRLVRNARSSLAAPGTMEKACVICPGFVRTYAKILGKRSEGKRTDVRRDPFLLSV